MPALLLAFALAESVSSAPLVPDVPFDLSPSPARRTCASNSGSSEIVVCGNRRAIDQLPRLTDDKDHVIGEAEFHLDNGVGVRFGLQKHVLSAAQQKAAPDLDPIHYTDVPGITITIPFR